MTYTGKLAPGTDLRSIKHQDPRHECKQSPYTSEKARRPGECHTIEHGGGY